MLIKGFTSAFNTVLKIVKDSPVLIDLRSDRVFIAGFNSLHAVSTEIPLQETNDNVFSFHLTSEVAKEIAKSLSDNIEFILVDTNVTINSDKVRLKIPVTSGTSLGSMFSKYVKSKSVTVDGNAIKSIVEFCKHAANDKEIGDIVMRGYHLLLSPEGLSVLTSNGSMLATASVPILQTALTDNTTLLLNEDFSSLTVYFEDRVIHMGYSSDTLSIEIPTDNYQIRVITSLVSGQPLEYENIISSIDENIHTFKINKVELDAALKSLQLFFRNNSDNFNDRVVDLEVSSEFLTLNANNQYGEANTKIPITDHNNSDTTVLRLEGINLQKYVKSLSGIDTIIVCYKDTTSAIFLTDENNYTKEVMVLAY